MCLVAYRTEPLIAEEDIVVHKILDKRGNKRYFSPYFGNNFEWFLGEIKSNKICQTNGYASMLTADIKEDVEKRFPDFDPRQEDKLSKKKYIVIAEGLHSINKDYPFAIERYRWNTEIRVECVIPAGAKYYVDLTGNCYVSDKLKITKQISL